MCIGLLISDEIWVNSKRSVFLRPPPKQNADPKRDSSFEVVVVVSISGLWILGDLRALEGVSDSTVEDEVDLLGDKDVEAKAGMDGGHGPVGDAPVEAEVEVG